MSIHSHRVRLRIEPHTASRFAFHNPELYRFRRICLCNQRLVAKALDCFHILRYNDEQQVMWRTDASFTKSVLQWIWVLCVNRQTAITVVTVTAGRCAGRFTNTTQLTGSSYELTGTTETGTIRKEIRALL